jgi:oligoribonuclease
MLAIFLDIETTGLDPYKHRPIDIAIKIMDVSTGHCRGSYQSIIKQSPEAWDVRDLSSIQVNEFTWDLVASGKEVPVISSEIITLFQQLKIERGNAIFICQNPSFDRCFFSQIIEVYTQEKLKWPYHWLDLASMYWMHLTQKAKQQGTAFPDQVNVSKNEIAKANQLPEELMPHRAMRGVEHLILCYEAVLGVKFKGE